MRTLLIVVLVTVPAAVMAQQPSGSALPPSGSVAVPLDEYDKLVDLAAKPEKKPERPPVAYTLNRADLKLRVAGASVTGTMQLEGEVLSKGSVKVPLVSGVTMVDAQAQGRPLPLQQDGGAHAAVLSGPGDFAITIETGTQLHIEPGRASFGLPVPPAGTVRLTLVVPGENTNVGISPGLVTSRASANGQTTVEATLVPGQAATVGWTTREAVAPVIPREVRFLSDLKTLASVSDGQFSIAALADITVVQGEPAQFEMAVPKGYEVTDATGASLESSEVQDDVLVLKIAHGTQRSHQFLVSMERAIEGSQVEVPILSFKGAQRETGEMLVESDGPMELAAKETGGLKRMDLKEVNQSLRSLARDSLQAAFRYHRQPSEAAGLTLEWVRFPDSNVQAAVAQRAVVTTLVTAEGRSLTEVRLTVSNLAQPFLKLALPPGATIYSAEVAGEKVKPVEGADGARVPLLRPGFKPSGPYSVIFVFLHSGAPFAKKGGSELGLPRMDIPISLVQWEVFLPDRYKVKDFGGDAIPLNLLAYAGDAAAWPVAGTPSPALHQGQVTGVVYDPTGAVIPNASVALRISSTGIRLTAVTDGTGRWTLHNVPDGAAVLTASASGFDAAAMEILNDSTQPTSYDQTLTVRGARTEVSVVGSTAIAVQAESSEVSTKLNRQMISQVAVQGRDAAELLKMMPGVMNNTWNASANVGNLQRRVAGVLPIAVDVPHAGNSYRFVRALVLDEETKVTFSYKTR